jgi:Tfp pilus assembly protein PilX
MATQPHQSGLTPAFRHTDSGSALVLALMLTTLLAGLGVSVAVTADVERRAAANASYSLRALYAADAAINRAIADLTALPDWNGVLGGTEQSAFADAALAAPSPAGGTLDLAAATTDLQAESNAAGLFGANTPMWRLFAWGRYSVLTMSSANDVPEYVAVWIADDPAETDGNANMDTNGTVTLHADGWGPGGARRVVEATVTRVPAGGLRVISWRENTL